MGMSTATYEALKFAPVNWQYPRWAWGEQTCAYTDWQQVSGDISASAWGAVFGRVLTETSTITRETRQSVELVKVYNFEVDAGEMPSDPNEYGPYYVETYTLEPWLMGESEAKRYFEALVELDGVSAADNTLAETLQAIAESIAEYGFFEQTSVGGGWFQTLKAAMESQDIPQAALWRSSKYDERIQWGRACKVLPLEHIYPRANHLAALATEAMRLVDANENTSDILKHMAQVAESIVRHGDELPAWYADYHDQPCDGWRGLETF